MPSRPMSQLDIFNVAVSFHGVSGDNIGVREVAEHLKIMMNSIITNHLLKNNFNISQQVSQ